MSAGATSVTAVYVDASGDAIYPDADVQQIALLYEEPLIGIGITTNWLVGGNRLALYVDSDLNDATGWQGADYAFFYERYLSGELLIFGIWNGSAWLLGAPTVDMRVGINFLNLVFQRSHVGSPTRGIDVFALGGNATIPGPGDRYSDRAPNSGSWLLDFQPTAVGGASAPGDTAPAAAPQRAPKPPLSLPDARQAAEATMRHRLGGKAVVRVGDCHPQGVDQIRCDVRARRGRLAWRGAVTVTGSPGAASASFLGKRINRACRRRSGDGCRRQVGW